RRTTLRLFLSVGGLGVLAACAAPTAAPAPATPTSAAPPPAAPTATTGTATSTAAAPAATTAATAVSASAAAKPAPTPAAASTAPKSGGTLRFGQVGDIVNLEPQFNQNTTSENTWLAYDRLTAYDTNWTPRPMLAETWDLSPDAKQIKVNLRKGVQ